MVALSLVALSLYVAGFFPHTYKNGFFVTNLDFDFATGGGNVIQCDVGCLGVVSQRLVYYGGPYHVREGKIETTLPEQTLSPLLGKGEMNATIDGRVVFTKEDVFAYEGAVSNKDSLWLFTVPLLLSPKASQSLAEATAQLEGDSFLSSPLVINIDNFVLTMGLPAQIRGAQVSTLTAGGFELSFEAAEHKRKLLGALLQTGAIEDEVSLFAVGSSFGKNFLSNVAFALIFAVLLQVLVFHSKGLWREGVLSAALSASMLLFSLATLAFFGVLIDVLTVFSLATPVTFGLHVTAHLVGGGRYKNIVRRSFALTALSGLLYLTSMEGAGLVLLSTAVSTHLFSPAVREWLRVRKD